MKGGWGCDDEADDDAMSPALDARLGGGCRMGVTTRLATTPAI